MNRRNNGGFGLVEILAVLAVGALAAAVAFPALAEARARAAASAGAHELAILLAAQRFKSAALGTTHGLFFDRDERGWYWYEVQDGNGNGLRTSEVRDGTDPRLAGPERLESSAAGAALGLPPTGPFPEIPPRRGWIDPSGDPIRFGASNLISFGPLGTASSGRIYVTDGRSELRAVVVFGGSGRIRVWRYDAGSETWRL